MGKVSIKLEQKSPSAVQATLNDLQVTVDRPVEKGGGGQGPMGGQYMLIGIGGCFCSTLLAAAKSRAIEVAGLAIEINATLAEEGAPRFTAIGIEVYCEEPKDPIELAKLIAIAEKGCISINTVKNGVNFSASLAS